MKMRINGKRVVDASGPLKITITQRDATLGKTKDPGGCAAARAIVRGYRDDGAKAARVHIGRTYVEYDDKWVRYKTPDPLKAEIVSFDRGTKPEFMVGEYKLLRMAPCERLGARPSSTKVGGPKETRHKPRIARRKIARIHHQIEGVCARGANR
jgi:hypothetical protein